MTRLLILMLAGIVAGCGGSGGSDPTPPPPPASHALTITLAGTGSMPMFFATEVPSGFRLMNSLAEYDALYSGLAGPNKPLELRTLDFAQFSVMYVEGPADDFLGAAARLVEIRRTGAADSVTGERCVADITAIPTPSRAYRPYAFYIVPKLSVSTTYAWTNSVNACATVTPVSVTLVAAGDTFFGGNLPQPPFLFRAIRTQAELDAVLPSFALGVVPPQYRAPDFSQFTLLFVAANGDFDPNSYVRVDRVYENDDGSHDVMAEYCGPEIAGLPGHMPFALYAVPRFNEAARLVLIAHQPGSCVLSR